MLDVRVVDLARQFVTGEAFCLEYGHWILEQCEGETETVWLYRNDEAREEGWQIDLFTNCITIPINHPLDIPNAIRILTNGTWV